MSMSQVDKTSEQNDQATGEVKSKYTFFEAFIVLTFIISVFVDGTIFSLICGLCLFRYIHNKSTLADKKIKELSDLVMQNTTKD